MSYMKYLLSVLLLVVATFSVSAKNKTNKDEWKYDIECAGSGEQGVYIVKVWTYAKNANVASDLMKKNAVHGVLFRGFGGERGCTAQKPIAGSIATYHEKQEYFNTFFQTGGTFLKYANIMSPTPEVIKVGKKEFKVGVVVAVSKDMLRKDLEQAGVIRNLSSGF